ncbi:MAG TPA: cobalamin-dependent protein [Thermoleophilia bacterium]|nr:cobalamin-dependent protein [Thermoleophilia bacterium]
MDDARVLLVFPASRYGGCWADGPRVKPELVTLLTELRRAGRQVDVLDLEVELGNPVDDEARAGFLGAAEERLRAYPADLVVVSCWSALQYTAAVAVAECVRRLRPGAVVAVEGYHVSVRPDDFAYEGSPFDWLIVGEAENAVLELAQAISGGERGAAGCRVLEGTPFSLDAAHAPDFAAYPYVTAKLPELDVFLSRGCPYNAPACLLRPGGAGWHAYPSEVALAIIDGLAALEPGRIAVLDPAFGYDPAWRRAVLDGVAASDRRDLAISLNGRPDALVRLDLDKMYAARVRLRLDVGTLSPALLSRTGQALHPRKAVEHALDLLTYANAKGVVTAASFTFNQPGETEATATETLDAIERFVGEAPNASVTLHAESWAYLPAGEPAADLEAPARRFGTRVVRPEWWKEPVPSEAAAKAVVASRELGDRAPGDESYWRPRFEQLQQRMAAKLTTEARHGSRSHESVGAEAYGVPNGWWIEPRWH